MDRNELSNLCRPAEHEEVNILREAASLRPRIAFDMAAASRRAGIRIQTDNLVFASRDDLTLASTAVTGLDSLDLDKLERGTSILFFYFTTPDSAALEPGFYTLRISGSKGIQPGDSTQREAIPASAWRGQLFDMNGNFARAVPVTVKTRDTPTDTLRIKLTASVSEGGCTLDAHWGKISVVVMIDF